MFYRFSFIENERLVKVKVYGRTDRQGILMRLQRLVSDHRWQQGYKVLVDYTGVTAFDMSGGGAEKPLSFLRDIPDDRMPIGVAYILPERLFHHFDRMPIGVAYTIPETHQDRFNHPILSLYSLKKGLQVDFFRTEAEALEWLNQLDSELIAEG